MKHDEIRWYALKLGIVLIGIYIVQLLVEDLTGLLAFSVQEATQRPWALFTSMLVHNPADYMHLLNNLFFLVVFGTLLELTIGSRAMLGVFIVTGLVAGLAAFQFYPESQVLGASGGVSGIVATLAIIRPKQIGLFWGVPVPMWVVLIGWLMTNAVGIGASAGIAYEAHLYGLVAGIATGIHYRMETEQEEQSSDDRIEEADEELEQRIKEFERRYMR